MFIVDGYFWIEDIFETVDTPGDNSTSELIQSHISWDRGPEYIPFLAMKTGGGQLCLQSSIVLPSFSPYHLA